jgi:two-component system, NtrC family, nitrogen regulation sensor histidine kinase NtrY
VKPGKQIFALLIIAIILYGISTFNFFPGNNNSVNARATERKLHNAEKEILSFTFKIGALAENHKSLQPLLDFQQKNEKQWQQKGYFFLVFKNDSLYYWTDNKIAFSNISTSIIDDYSLIKLRNGWYETFNKKFNGTTVLSFLLLKNDFVYQNKFLQNNFNPLLNINDNAEIKSSPSDTTVNIKSGNGKFLFSVYSPPTTQTGQAAGAEVLNLLLFSLFLILLFCIFYLAGNQILHNSNLFFLKFIYPLFLFLVVFLAVIYRIPPGVFELRLFSSQLYASSVVLNSLGSLLLLTFSLLFSVSYYYKLLNKELRFNRLWFGWFSLLFYFLLVIITNYLIYGLIINSNISFDVNNILSLSPYSLLGFLAISALLFAIYLVAQATINNYRRLDKNKFYISLISITGSVTVIYYLFSITELFKPFNIWLILWAVIFLISIYFLTKKEKPSYEFSMFLPVIILLSSLSGYAVFKFNKIKEQNSRVIIAQRLERDRDYVAEYLFDDISAAVRNDRLLTGLVANPFQNAEAIERRVNQLYFAGYWNKYDINIYIFDSLSTLYYNPDKDTVSLQSFRLLIDNRGLSTTNPDFYFINEPTGRTRYLAFLPISFPSGNLAGTLVADMEARRMQEQNGFPELLLSSTVSSARDIMDYSYARFNNEMLITQHGDVAYPLRHRMLDIKTGDYQFIESKQYNHLIYRSDPNSAILLTKKKETWLDYVTVFSYMFAFFSMLTLIYGYLKLIPYKFSLTDMTFKRRIQQSMTLIVVASLLLIGAGTVIYIINNNKEQKREQISNLLTSALVAIENEFLKSEQANELNEELSIKLGKIAEMMSADFHIYDDAGSLLFSTQPKLFDHGLVSRKMHPGAYVAVSIKNNSRYVQNERIGALNFLSAYAPLRNENNRTIGILNLPYFAKEGELKNEISAFLVALINVYLLLLVLAVIIAVLVANRLTVPLKLIREKLGQTKLGSRNEYIEWSRQDEIGDLVGEYNRMVDQLTDSAELLAKSERELAWREMAKQVAHEIKNPLTPMKLSVQHLERIWKEDVKDKEGRVKRLTQTLIQQIDTLSAIATEFSNFAKLPKPQLEEVDLVQLLEGITNLYGQQDNIETHFSAVRDKIIIMADKDQLLRILNNILKNAQQAIPVGEKGLVNVNLSQFEDHILISIRDNGEGIHPEKYGNIFQPNFTTKTGGTGLGLSMVKNIVKSMGGEIWFESELNSGTTFLIKLPHRQV